MAYFCFQKFTSAKSNSSGHIQGRRAGTGRQADKAGNRLIDVPTLTFNIFVWATNRTNIHNKTGVY
jgi:hypothetical protein